MVRIASVCRMRHCVSTVNVSGTVEYAVSAGEFMTIMTKSAVIPSVVTVGVWMADESRTVVGRSGGVSRISATISTNAPATSVIAALRRDDANQERQSC